MTGPPTLRDALRAAREAVTVGQFIDAIKMADEAGAREAERILREVDTLRAQRDEAREVACRLEERYAELWRKYQARLRWEQEDHL